jgi:hypothetical protein
MNTNPQQSTRVATGGILAAIMQQVHETADWPVSAQYKVVYRMHTWPCGWDEPRVQFFDSDDEYIAWVKEMTAWALCDDNAVEYRTYVWDWGPQLTDGDRLG